MPPSKASVLFSAAFFSFMCLACSGDGGKSEDANGSVAPGRDRGSAESTSAEGVGDPCVPDDEWSADFSGFSLAEVSVDPTAQCDTGLCLVNHFQGRVTCPYGQQAAEGVCTTPEAEPVLAPVSPQLEARRAEDAVYCSCRCDGQYDDVEYCACPGGYSCERLLDEALGAAAEQWAGSYCVPDGTHVDDPSEIPPVPCANGSCGDVEDATAEALGIEASEGAPDELATTAFVTEVLLTSVDKIDLVFVIDNSLGMEGPQALFSEAIAEFVGQLTNPPCVDASGSIALQTSDASEACPTGTTRRFYPQSDIHVAVLTTSLGGYGAAATCVANDVPESEQTVDMAHLLGSLPRGASAVPEAAATGFLSWTPSSQRVEFTDAVAALVASAGTSGCGWESPLEAWTRFLVDPFPHTRIVRAPCVASDVSNLCAGPETDGAGNLLVDAVVLDQRAQFLRPDSLLAVVMLSDENDCSFLSAGQQWRLAQASDESGVLQSAYKATAVCDQPDYGPNHECCHSCGVGSVPAGCPSATDETGQTVGVGCEAGRQYEPGPLDHPNLRCFEQKRRFGVDYLFPVARYTNALTLRRICPFAPDLDPESSKCPDGQGVQDNPLFVDLSATTEDGSFVPAPRSLNHIYLSALVGVPWQDLAVDPNPASALAYRGTRPDDSDRVDWSLILGDRPPPLGFPNPTDPLMLESIAPRAGTQPITGEAIAEASPNSINGSEWNIFDGSALQYACIAELPEPRTCLSDEEVSARQVAGEAVPRCVCTGFGAADYANPLCDGLVQTHQGAHPGLRQLEVLRDYGKNAVPASICPKSLDPAAADYGYRPWVSALRDRMSEQLSDRCLPQQLPVVESDGGKLVSGCYVLEALPPGESCGSVRSRASESVAALAYQYLSQVGACADAASCEHVICEIEQLTPESDEEGYEDCLEEESAQADGWCYLAPAQDLGAETLVASCPDTAKRRLRFIGEGVPSPGSAVILACAGAAL